MKLIGKYVMDTYIILQNHKQHIIMLACKVDVYADFVLAISPIITETLLFACRDVQDRPIARIT